MRILLSLFVLSLPLAAQQADKQFTWGAKVGIPLGPDDFSAINNGAGSAPVTVGPFINMKIWKNLSFEFNPMWRRTANSYSGTSYFTVPENPDFGLPERTYAFLYSNKTRNQIIDYTFLGRWDFPSFGRWRPFLSAGYVRRWQHTDSDNNSIDLSGGYYNGTTFYPFPSTWSSNSYSIWRNGFAAGGGVSFDAGRFRIEPEYRYTGISSQDVRRSAWFNTSRTAWDHSHDFMLGIRF